METNPNAGRFAQMLMDTPTEHIAKTVGMSADSIARYKRGEGLPKAGRCADFAFAIGKKRPEVEAAYAVDALEFRRARKAKRSAKREAPTE